MGRKEALSPELPLSPGDYQHMGSAHAAIRSPPPEFGMLRESNQRSLARSSARERLSLALDWGPPALLDCIGTGGAAHGWVAAHGGLAVQLEGPRGTLSAGLPQGMPGLFTLVAVLLSTQRAHHPGDRSRCRSGGEGAMRTERSVTVHIQEGGHFCTVLPDLLPPVLLWWRSWAWSMGKGKETPFPTRWHVKGSTVIFFCVQT